MLPTIISDCRTARERVLGAQREAITVGLIPTMGALHEGHLSLVRAAQQECEYTVVTIFVNPTQFAPHEDLARYPRQLEQDRALLAELEVDFIFHPAPEEMYPQDFSTYVLPPRVAQRWEGEYRPEHFRGVATVVLKLFNILPADFAYFGQKDFQQAAVIRRMCRDLNVATEIEVCPIVRDADGLALSSRNVYLSPEERTRGLGLIAALRAAEQGVREGETTVAVLEARMRDTLRAAGVVEVDYAVVVDRETLDPLERLDRPAVALLAARVGGTRLIDNHLLEPPS